MRSFVILSLLACTLAAPITEQLEKIPVVNEVTSTAGQALTPVTNAVAGAVELADETTGSSIPGEVVGEVMQTAGSIKRSPITEVLNAVPGVQGITAGAGQLLSPVTGELPTVLNTVDGLPGGTAVSGAAKEALSILGSLRRRALTSALEGIPAVPELTQTAGQLLSPVTGQVLPEVEQQLNAVPGGAAVVQLLNTGLGTLGSLRRRALTSALEGIPAVPELTQTAGQLLSPVTGQVLPEVEQQLNAVPGGAAVVQLLNTGLGTLGSLRRRALTSALEGIPAVPELTQTAGQLLSPVTGQVLPEVEQQLNAVPGGAAVVQLLNTGIGTLGSL